MNYSSTKRVGVWRILVLICIPVFLGSLDLTVVTAFLPVLLSDLSLNLDTDGLGSLSWLLTGYLLAYALSLFIMGRASDWLGRRRAFTLALLLYVAGSLLVIGYTGPAAILSNLYTSLGWQVEVAEAGLHALLLGRVVAALGAGAITSIAIALVGDLFDESRRTLPLGIVIATDTVGWLVGAAWGGVVIQALPWQAIFLINIPLVLLALILLLILLPRDIRRQQRQGVDWIGALLLAGALIAMNVVLDRLSSGEQGLQVEPALPVLGVLFVLVVLFVVVERRVQQPLIDREVLSDSGALSATVINLLVGFCLFIPLVGVPVLANIRQLDIVGFAAAVDSIREVALRDASLITGMLLAAFTLPIALGSVISERVIHWLGQRSTTLLGLLLAASGFALMSQLLSLEISNLVLAALFALTGLGIGLTFTPVIAVTLMAAGEARRGAASALVLGMRMIGMTTATATLSIYASQRVLDILVAVEQGGFFFERTAPVDYPTTFLTTYLNASGQMLQEISLVGLLLCVLALIPVRWLRERAQ